MHSFMDCLELTAGCGEKMPRVCKDAYLEYVIPIYRPHPKQTAFFKSPKSEIYFFPRK